METNNKINEIDELIKDDINFENELNSEENDTIFDELKEEQEKDQDLVSFLFDEEDNDMISKLFKRA